MHDMVVNAVRSKNHVTNVLCIDRYFSTDKHLYSTYADNCMYCGTYATDTLHNHPCITGIGTLRYFPYRATWYRMTKHWWRRRFSLSQSIRKCPSIRVIGSGGDTFFLTLFCSANFLLNAAFSAIIFLESSVCFSLNTGNTGINEWLKYRHILQ